ncbi:MAG: Crp/Fnr family transcriptional regulator [Ferruginibacter sp.]
MNDEIKFVYLKNQPLFAGLTDQQVMGACSFMKAKTVYRGETFDYGAGEYSKIFLLIKGKIKITLCDEMDNELIKDILTAPEVFGDLSLDGFPASDEFAEALTVNTVVCFFNSSDFKKLLRNNSMLAVNYANMVNNKLKRLESRHSDLVFHDAKVRLIRFLKNWARTDGNRIGDKIILNNYLTHSDIAGVIATSRQSVNVMFNELREAGILFYDRKRIELNDGIVWN